MEFICDYCSLQFKGRGYLMRHIEMKHQMFYCEGCKAAFKQKRNLLNHLRNHFEKYICEYCSLQFNYEKLHQHIATVHEPHKREYAYDCRFCERKFPNAIFRNCHERDVHKGRDDSAFKCSTCQIVFLKKDQMRLHNLEKHHKGAIFICSYKECDRYFKNLKLLKIHELVHGPPSYQCSQCRKKFKQSSNYSKHKKRCKGVVETKEYTGEELEQMSLIARNQFDALGGKIKKIEAYKDESFININDTKVAYLKEFEKEVMTNPLHISDAPKKRQRAMRGNKNYELISDDSLEKLLCCDKCAMQFDSKREFRKHQRNCKPEGSKISFKTPVIFSTENIKMKPNEIFKCSELNCQLTFKSKGNLRKHISQVHLNERFFQCDKCAKFCKTKYHLQLHLKTHGIPRQCPICSVILPNIEAHIKRHERPKQDPFKCSQCNRQCASKQTLNEHIQRIHEKKPLEKVYSCPICHESFIRNSDLRRHSFLHYHGKIYSCTHYGCPEMFKTSYKLQLHQIIHKEKNIKTFICEFCSKTYPRQTALYKHKKIHLVKKT